MEPSGTTRKTCENCDGLGHTDGGTTVCPRCLDTGVTSVALTRFVGDARTLAELVRRAGVHPSADAETVERIRALVENAS